MHYSHWWTVAIVGALLAVVATLAERRRNNRADLERVGFVPWPMVMMLSLLTAVVAIGLAMQIA